MRQTKKEKNSCELELAQQKGKNEILLKFLPNKKKNKNNKNNKNNDVFFDCAQFSRNYWNQYCDVKTRIFM